MYEVERMQNRGGQTSRNGKRGWDTNGTTKPNK
jgi:hypothetical protein